MTTFDKDALDRAAREIEESDDVADVLAALARFETATSGAGHCSICAKPVSTGDGHRHPDPWSIVP
jgi:hypothetical protein